jgi:hypothetical protein
MGDLMGVRILEATMRAANQRFSFV